MHQDSDAAQALSDEPVTDSMRMFPGAWNVAGPGLGKSASLRNGSIRAMAGFWRAHGEPLPIPEHADDGGEEAEVAAVYVIGPGGKALFGWGWPWATSFRITNTRRKITCTWAGSKLRMCSLGPELVVGGEFRNVAGGCGLNERGARYGPRILRVAKKHVPQSEQYRAPSFQIEAHRHPGEVHVHYLGADAA